LQTSSIKLKQIAREKGIGYQPLIRMWLLEKLTEEIGRKK
jgi:predicted DNA binding CopG/RHH family protein